MASGFRAGLRTDIECLEYRMPKAMTLAHQAGVYRERCNKFFYFSEKKVKMAIKSFISGGNFGNSQEISNS